MFSTQDLRVPVDWTQYKPDVGESGCTNPKKNLTQTAVKRPSSLRPDAFGPEPHRKWRQQGPRNRQHEEDVEDPSALPGRDSDRTPRALWALLSLPIKPRSRWRSEDAGSSNICARA